MKHFQKGMMGIELSETKVSKNFRTWKSVLAKEG